MHVAGWNDTDNSAHLSDSYSYAESHKDNTGNLYKEVGLIKPSHKPSLSLRLQMSEEQGDTHTLFISDIYCTQAEIICPNIGALLILNSANLHAPQLEGRLEGDHILYHFQFVIVL